MDRQEKGTKIQGQKSWVLKGLDSQHVRGYCHPSNRTVRPSHPTHPRCPWPMRLGLSRGVCLSTPSHLLRLPLSARELREPSEPW